VGHGSPPVPIAERKRRCAAVEKAYSLGFLGGRGGGPNKTSAVTHASCELDLSRGAINSWMRFELQEKRVGRQSFVPDKSKFRPPPNLRSNDHEEKEEVKKHKPAQAWTQGKIIELTSDKDDCFTFGAAGDLHAASKYCRWDVREALYRYFIEQGASCNIDSGNWIDGESHFNKYDLEAVGFDNQCLALARDHPRGLPTYAVWGDDHEGWYVQREGVNVGRHAEHIMREEGHDWTNLGYMEAHVLLKNRRSGEVAVLSVNHPGGGSAYAVSYKAQKIVESMEGGEKPAVLLIGHYHKLFSFLIRNVWCVGTGCQQDQTPFLRKNNIEAHVGGALIKLKQNPNDGSIISMNAELIRFFNRGYPIGGRWSRHGPVSKLARKA